MKPIDESSQELLEKLPRETWHHSPTLPPFVASTMLSNGRNFFSPSPSTILKRRKRVDESEAAMTVLARSMLGPCVPRIHSIVTFTKPANHQGLIMTHQPGRPLAELWPTLSPSQREIVKTNLCHLLVKMRANDDHGRPRFAYYGRPVRQPYVLPSIFNKYEYPCCTSRSEWDDSRTRALHLFDADFGSHIDPNRAERVAALERVQRTVSGAPGWDRPVLTHVDLSNRNILAQPDTLEISGFIDWEMANIMPAYFEYAFAQMGTSHDEEWRIEISDVLRSVLRIECGCDSKPGREDDLNSAKVDEGLKLYEKTLAAWDAVTEVERALTAFRNELD